MSSSSMAMRKSSISSFPTFLSEEACLFCSSILEGITALAEALEEGPVSLLWATKALDFLKMVQIQLLPLLKKTGSEEDLFDQYMNDSVVLLDLCNSLKVVISRIIRYRMMSELTIHTLLRNTDTSTLLAMNTKELERETRAIVTVGHRVKNSSSIDFIMLAAKSTVTTISLLLTSAFVSSVSIQVESARFSSAFPQLKPIVAALKKLIRQFEERTSSSQDSSKLLSFFELEMVDKVVQDLKTQVVGGVVINRQSFLHGIELLGARTVLLKKSIDKYDTAVDGVFDMVIRGRNDIMEIYKTGALSTE